jgi:hypothetical protein
LAQVPSALHRLSRSSAVRHGPNCSGTSHHEHSTAELAELFGVARSTVYRALDRDRDRAQGAGAGARTVIELWP